MEYVELGDTGERASRPGFGGASDGLANYLGEYDPPESAARKRAIGLIKAVNSDRSSTPRGR